MEILNTLSNMPPLSQITAMFQFSLATIVFCGVINLILGNTIKYYFKLALDYIQKNNLL